ncbi:unnamed protein product [Cylicocyclus nassatus]|uniref:Uncharacterized protein n=1 Tax=Cylicocyclus nassatus TaxID=53992 RepID=A0AA36MDY6_CYLNA|nr:unnamed protein product [Cylicocyclus nassatus]
MEEQKKKAARFTDVKREDDSRRLLLVDSDFQNALSVETIYLSLYINLPYTISRPQHFCTAMSSQHDCSKHDEHHHDKHDEHHEGTHTHNQTSAHGHVHDNSHQSDAHTQAHTHDSKCSHQLQDKDHHEHH